MCSHSTLSQTVMPRSLRRQLISRLIEALALEGALCSLLLALIGEARAATPIFTAVTGTDGIGVSEPVPGKNSSTAENPKKGIENPFQRMEAPADVPKGLSRSEWSTIRAEYEKHRHAANPIENQPGVWQARNPGQQWFTRFDGRGFLVQPDGAEWRWGLELQRYGFDGNEIAVERTAGVTAEKQRVSYRWDTVLEEWFVNDTRGLEHGFTVIERPVGEGGPLRLDLTVRGGLRPEVMADGNGVRFVDVQGAAVVNYTGLKVWDATGRLLAAAFEPMADGVRLVVEESGAQYPLTIDPKAQQAYLKASNTGASDQFGTSVAVSGDTVVVGAR
jgi:hypothetical protein